MADMSILTYLNRSITLIKNVLMKERRAAEAVHEIRETIASTKTDKIDALNEWCPRKMLGIR